MSDNGRQGRHLEQRQERAPVAVTTRRQAVLTMEATLTP
jgi:hypothetical protein